MVDVDEHIYGVENPKLVKHLQLFWAFLNRHKVLKKLFFAVWT